jgi:glycosyltransferase involved in cell wall biosynthesis
MEHGGTKQEHGRDWQGSALTVTVAVACYNHGRFLCEALFSAQRQTRPADAIVVVDDGSNDATRQICALFPTVAYIRQDNAGLSAARNTALRLAGTSHILFLDADDMLLPCALERALALHTSRPGLAFAYGGYRDVDEIGAVLAEHAPVEVADAFERLLGGNFIAMHGTVVYDVMRLRDVGGFDTELQSCEDWDVYLKLARRESIAAYSGAAADYRRHGDGMSSDSARMIMYGRTVLARQVASGLTLGQRQRAEQGRRFMTHVFASRLLGQLKRAVGAVTSLFLAGLRQDRWFLVRLIRLMALAMFRPLRARQER